MLTRMFLITGALLVMALVPCWGQTLIEDPGDPDWVMVDSAIVSKSGPGLVTIDFVNDEPLAGIEITLIFDSPDVTIDSISFAASRVEYATVKGFMTSDSTITVYCFPISEESLIAPGTGLFGTLYFSYPPSIDTQVVTIDTFTIINGDIEYSTTFSDSISNTFKPQFLKGYLDIIESGGCCIGNRGNVDGSPDDVITVGDLTYLIAYLFQGGPPPPCMPEGNVDGDELGVVVGDLTYLVAYLFQGGAIPPLCP